MYREVTYLSSDLSWAALPYAYACGCVLAYADKRLTIFNHIFRVYGEQTDLLLGAYVLSLACSFP